VSTPLVGTFRRHPLGGLVHLVYETIIHAASDRQPDHTDKSMSSSYNYSDLTERSDWTSFHRRSPSAADDWIWMVDSSSPNWIDPNYRSRCSYLVIDWIQVIDLTGFVSHPDSLAWRHSQEKFFRKLLRAGHQK